MRRLERGEIEHIQRRAHRTGPARLYIREQERSGKAAAGGNVVHVRLGAVESRVTLRVDRDIVPRNREQPRRIRVERWESQIDEQSVTGGERDTRRALSRDVRSLRIHRAGVGSLHAQQLRAVDSDLELVPDCGSSRTAHSHRCSRRARGTGGRSRHRDTLESDRDGCPGGRDLARIASAGGAEQPDLDRSHRQLRHGGSCLLE